MNLVGRHRSTATMAGVSTTQAVCMRGKVKLTVAKTAPSSGAMLARLSTSESVRVDVNA